MPPTFFSAFLTLLCLAIMPLTSNAHANDPDTRNFTNAHGHWTLLAGYATTHPGLGDTATRVVNLDLALQYGRFLTQERGRSWYKGRHKLLAELPISIVFEPDNAIMTGITFLGCWDFTASRTLVPYVCAGGGFLYTNLNTPGLGSEYNGNYQGGIGLHYFFMENTSIDLNYRLHHVSNAGTATPNEPLNSSKLYVGLSFLRY